MINQGFYLATETVAERAGVKESAYVVKDGSMKEFELKMGELTDNEREIILNGCLINYNRNKK